MRNKSTSVLPRVLFLLALLGLVAVFLYFWLRYGWNAVSPVTKQSREQFFSMVSESVPGLSRRFTVEIRTDEQANPDQIEVGGDTATGSTTVVDSRNSISSTSSSRTNIINNTTQQTVVEQYFIPRTPFSGITSGTNTAALMIVGRGGTLTYVGGEEVSGGINANRLENRTWADPLVIGSSSPNAAAFTDVTVGGKLTAKGNVTLEQLRDGFLRVNGAGEVTASRVNLGSSSDVAGRLPTANGGTGNDFSNTATGSLLSFSATGQMMSIDPGPTGYFLTSNGDGAVPSWTAVTPGLTNFTNLGSGTNTTSSFVVGTGSSLSYAGSGSVNASSLQGLSWDSPGSIGSTTPNTGRFTQLTATGTTTPLSVGSSGQLRVTDNGRMEIVYVGDSGYLSSSGGAIFIDNTNNIGTGIGIYSNAGAAAQGNMINIKVDNPLYNQAAFYMNYDGVSNAVEIVSNTNDESSNALAVTGNNILDSTVGIIGYELNRGTVKITHNRPGAGNDSSASGLSIDLKGVGTRAQGLYVDSTEVGGTLGNLLRLRNESIDRFVVGPTGNTFIAGNVTHGAVGTNTTYTKLGSTAGDEFFVGTNGAFRIQRSAGNSEAFRTQVAGDTQGRWLGTSDGQLKFGPGNATQDITLRRGLAGTLFLDGSIYINNLNQDLDTVIKGVNESNLLYVDASADRVGIGTSGPVAALQIVRNVGSLPTFAVNQLGSGDLITASSSGATQFTVSNAGNVSLAGALSVGSTTTLGGQTYTWPNSAGTNGYVLSTNGAGTLSWVSAASLNPDYWQENSGVLAPVTLSNSLALGKTTALTGAALDIAKDSGTNALALFNQTGSGDILTASASGTTRFVVKNDGRVGIGTSAPSAQLDVNGDVWTNNGANRFESTGLMRIGAANHYLAPSGGALELGGASTAGLNFEVNGGTRAVSILTNANVGIGNTTPSALLTVGTTAPFLVDSSGNVTVGTNGQNTTFTKNGNAAGDQFFVGTNGSFRVQRTGAGSEAFRMQVSGDTQGRWVGTSDGQLRWGSGSAAQDVTLRRGVAGTLYLDGSIFINNSNQDLDTVIKGLTDNNLFYVDAGADRIGIGTSGPAAALHIAKNPGSIPTLLVNQLGTGDVLTASVSGNTKFMVSNAGNVGINTSSFGTGAANVLAIANSTAPSTAITNGAQLFAVDVAGSHELQVMDEAGNITTLSPHNFSLIPDGRSEDLAWSFYSQRGGLAINADMAKALRVLEGVSGEQLVYIKDIQTGSDLSNTPTGLSLNERVGETSEELAQLQQYVSLSDAVWTFVKEVVFQVRVTFRGVVEFFDTVRFKAGAVFEQAVSFQGRLRVNRDTTGVAVIPAGATKVRVNFSRSFSTQPVVSLFAQQSITGKYELKEVSTGSFVIELSQAQVQPVNMQWWAVEREDQPVNVEVLEGSVAGATDDASATPSPSVMPASSPEPSTQPVVSPQASSSPVPSPSVVHSSSPSPSATPVNSPEPSPSPTASPVVSPSPSPIVEASAPPEPSPTALPTVSPTPLP